MGQLAYAYVQVIAMVQNIFTLSFYAICLVFFSVFL
jgi:hypothetical protein